MKHLTGPSRSLALRRWAVLFGGGAALVAASAFAVPTPQWELAVVAHGPGGSRSPVGSTRFGAPAIDRLQSTGAWQVAFATSVPGAWADGSQLVPGVHLQELGGAHKTIAKDLDPVPGNPGLVFCFSQPVCPVDADRVSLSQGEVAFKAQGANGGQANALTGIFLMNGPGGPRRVADTSTPMPGYPTANFGSFNSPSLSEGRVVFQASGGAPAMTGVYGDLGGGLSVVSDLNSVPVGVAADFLRFTDFMPFPSVSRTYWNSDEFVVAFGATGDARAPVGARLEGVLERNYSNGVGGLWTGLAIASPAVLQSYSPAVDFGAGVAYLGNGPAVYRGTPIAPVASVSTLVPGEAAPFQNLLAWPAADAAPRQLGVATMERWTAFVGTSPTSGQGVYLAHQTINVPSPVTTLEKVADGPALWKVLAPWVGASAADPMPPIVPVVFHQGVKDGAVAFTVTLGASSTAADFVVVATKTTPTLTLKADADTYVRADLDVRQNDNYGLQDFIEVGTGRAGTAQAEGAADKMRALLHFNTGVLPALRLNSAVLETTLHSYDNGAAGAVYTLGAYRLTTPWATAEGNGFEGARPPGALAALTDPDSAAGVAWRGAPLNPDPFAANNGTQPAFDAAVLATQVVRQATNVRGDKLQWDITPLARAWLDGTVTNHGVALTDATGDVLFRGLRMGSREGEAYGLPLAVSGPRLALKWTVGVMPGDLSGDACVDRDDLALMMAIVRGQAEPGAALAAKLDLNGDGKSDIADARKLVTLFSRPLGAPCPR